MSEPIIVQRKPFFVELKAGRAYTWCACGRSQRQPFCDGSHAGTGIEPFRFVADADREAVLCGCKHTRSRPFCDGTHNNLSDTYEEAGADEIRASESIPVTPPDGGETGRAVLNGGCYVMSVSMDTARNYGAMRLVPVIDRDRGAHFLSQYYAETSAGTSEILSFPGSEVVLFVSAGKATVNISGRDFEVGRECGAYIREGEAFRVHNAGSEPVQMVLTVCPQNSSPQVLESMPDNFDSSVPQRAAAADESQREPMADRFYQVLVGEETGSRSVTGFIGELPKSRAAGHHHLYEEAILILTGEGFMWTEKARARVRPGDIIFLPRKQLHSLECTSAGGMRLLGVFYPSGSPAVNY